MYLLHRSGVESLSADPAVQADYERCLPPDQAMLLGRQFCVRGSYPAVKMSDQHAYFPLSGPVDFTVTMTTVDK